MIANASGSGSGTQVLWEAQHDTGSSNEGSATITPSNNLSPITNQVATCTVDFDGVDSNSKFVINAKLADASGNTIQSAGVVAVKVSFQNVVPLTGVSLNTNALKIRIGTQNVYLTATPTPANPTNPSYVWQSTDPTVIDVLQNGATSSPDMTPLTAKKAGTSRIIVSATGKNGGPFTASCDVTVVSQDSLTEDIEAAPTDTDSAPPLIYGVDGPYLSAISVPLTPTEIEVLSGITNGKLIYMNNLAGKTIEVNRETITAADGVGIADYRDRVVSAFRFSGYANDSNGNKITGAMVPFKFVFNLSNRAYLNGNAIAVPSSEADFHNQYRIMKYFEKNATTYAINISNILAAKRNPYLTMESTRNFRLAPLVVLVDGYAPNSCDERQGPNQEYGVKYDNTKNILFIYDGYPDGTINDPIVLEKIPPSGGGGGGGGCSAGAGAFALFALAIAGLRSARGKR